MYGNICSSEAALEYMIECTLATIENLKMLKRVPKRELLRQILIAQNGLHYLTLFNSTKGVGLYHGRVEEVIKKFSGNVTTWADSI